MVRDLQIAQARRDSGEQSRDRRPPSRQRCIWCDTVGHMWKECVDFVEALRTNVVYLWNRRLHASRTQRALELNMGRGGMKPLMEETAARHAETVHYSASAGIRVGNGEGRKTMDSGFWPLVLGGLAGVQLKKEEADRAEKRCRVILHA